MAVIREHKTLGKHNHQYANPPSLLRHSASHSELGVWHQHPLIRSSDLQCLPNLLNQNLHFNRIVMDGGRHTHLTFGMSYSWELEEAAPNKGHYFF